MGLNLGDCLHLSAKARPQAPCLIYEHIRLSYAEADASACRVAGLLQSAGIQPGDAVALMLPNVPQFPIIYHGILYAGGVVVSLNPAMRPRELAHVVQDAGVKLIVAFEDMADSAAKVAADHGGALKVIVVEASLAPKAHAQGQSFMTAFALAEPVECPTQRQPEDLAVVVYTAAQHGRPRGAMLTHFNLFQNALTISTKSLRYYPEDKFLCILPLFHGFGQTTMMNGPLLAGSALVFTPRFDANQTLDLIARESVTLLAVVPTMLHFLVMAARGQDERTSSLRCVVSGGSKMNLETAAAFEEKFGISVLEGYGLTETSPVVSFNCDEEMNRPGSVGLPIWGCEVAIVDDADERLPAGEEGEVVIRGHNVFRGYLNDPEGSAQTVRHGWLHTGDLGYLDRDGYLFLTGLKKDMILRAGMNVYPREVELVLQTHPSVAEAAVVGVPDTVRGEDVKAFVVVGGDGQPTENELKAWCRDALTSYKCPRRIEFIEALPRHPDGSIDKAALRAREAVAAG